MSKRRRTITKHGLTNSQMKLDDFYRGGAVNQKKTKSVSRLGITLKLTDFSSLPDGNIICPRCKSDRINFDPYLYRSGYYVLICEKCGHRFPPKTQKRKRHFWQEKIKWCRSWLASNTGYEKIGEFYNVSGQTVFRDIRLLSLYSRRPIDVHKMVGSKASGFIGLDLTALPVRGLKFDYLRVGDSKFYYVTYHHLAEPRSITSADIYRVLKELSSMEVVRADEVKLVYIDMEKRVLRPVRELFGDERIVYDRFHLSKNINEILFKTVKNDKHGIRATFKVQRYFKKLMKAQTESDAKLILDEIERYCASNSRLQSARKALDFFYKYEEYFFNAFKYKYAPTTNNACEHQFGTIKPKFSSMRGLKTPWLTPVIKKLTDLIVTFRMFHPISHSRIGMEGELPIRQVSNNIDLNKPWYEYVLIEHPSVIFG